MLIQSARHGKFLLAAVPLVALTWIASSPITRYSAYQSSPPPRTKQPCAAIAPTPPPVQMPVVVVEAPVPMPVVAFEAPVHVPPRRSIAVVSSGTWDDCMRPAETAVVLNHRSYCQRHGYDYHRTLLIDDTIQDQFGRHRIFGKIQAVAELLDMYDWIMWIDIDALFMNHTIAVESILADQPDKNFVVAHPSTDRIINAGVFIIRGKAAAGWSRRFLEAILNETMWLRRFAWEQESMWFQTRKKEFADAVLVSHDDHLINSLCGWDDGRCIWKPGDYIVHFPAPQCPVDVVMRYVPIAQELNGYVPYVKR